MRRAARQRAGLAARPARQRRGRLGVAVRGIAALIALIALVGGLPVLLYKLGGSPIPRHLPTLPQLRHGLTRRDNGSLFLAAVRDISWLAWAAFTVAVANEVQAAARGKLAVRLRLGGLQSAAGNLVAFAMLTFSSSAAVLAVPQALAAASAAVSQPAQHAADAAPAAPAAPTAQDNPATSAAQVRSMGYHQLVTVRPGDCLWTIAEHYLGNGDRYQEITSLNIGHEMAGGVYFTDPSVILPGWVLQMPHASAAAASPLPDAAGHGSRAGGSQRHGGAGAAVHEPHPSHEPAFRKPHPAASPAVGQPSQPAAPPAAAAGSPDAQPGSAGRPDGGQVSAIPVAGRSVTTTSELAIFAAGMVAGGAVMTLSRMRHRQRQARRPGRRIPLPASAPVMAAERRMRADEPPVPAASLRSALGLLASGLAGAGDPVPEIAAIRISPQLMEVLLASPAETLPPLPFTEPPGDGMSWLLPLPPDPAGPDVALTGDLLPGLVTLGCSEDGYLLVDLEYLGVTEVAGPPGLADQVLATAAAELATSGLAGWYDLILVGFDELDVIGGRATCCDDFDSALDLMAAKAVTLRRRLPDAGPCGIRSRRISEPGDEDWALTLLVSRVTPGPGELAMLRDLAADPGGVAALLPVAGDRARTGAGNSRIELADDPGVPGGIAATVTPLGLIAYPQPLDDVDYRALASLFATAALDDDVDPGDPPYDGIAAGGWLGSLAREPADEYSDFWQDSENDEAWLADVRDSEDSEDSEDAAGPVREWTSGQPLTHRAPLVHEAAEVWPASQHPVAEAGEADTASGQDVPQRHAVNGTGNGFRWPQPGADVPEAGGRKAALPADWQPMQDNWRPVSQPDPGPADSPPADADAGPSGPRHARPEDPKLGLRIGVLGTFTVNGEPGALLPAQSQLLLALAVHGREGLSNRQLCELLGADPDHPKPSDSLRQLIVRTRRQLGRADDGREWIEHLGAGQYALHPQARVDWHEFDTLAREGMRYRDAPMLRDALRILRGEPFTGCYYWWLDSALLESVRAQVVDAAEMLSGLELASGDPAGAGRAARAGLAADPAAEQLWRALMRAEHAAGNLSAVREAWSRCLDVIDEIAADGEPHPDTSALYRELVSQPAARVARPGRRGLAHSPQLPDPG